MAAHRTSLRAPDLSDQRPYALNAPNPNTRAEQPAGREAATFDARPPGCTADGDDGEYLGQSHKTNFRKVHTLHCSPLPSIVGHNTQAPVTLT
jgi:hypothetical protein